GQPAGHRVADPLDPRPRLVVDADVVDVLDGAERLRRQGQQAGQLVSPERDLGLALAGGHPLVVAQAGLPELSVEVLVVAADGDGDQLVAPEVTLPAFHAALLVRALLPRLAEL